MIEATVDLNLSENHEYVIKPAFDKGLTGKGTSPPSRLGSKLGDYSVNSSVSKFSCQFYSYSRFCNPRKH